MTDTPTFPRYIFGLHEPGGEHLMEQAGKPGWIVFTHALGRNPNDRSGQDYRPWSDRGFGIIARLNHGYGTAGTIPQPQHYAAFAQRVRNFCAYSSGCHVWIIGNETNHAQERPDGQLITPDRYAECYIQCRQQIHGLPDREHDQVVLAPVAPWNNTTTYPGNESGDWVTYFADIIHAVRNRGGTIDAFALHTYTHGRDPRLVFSEQRMAAPFEHRRFHFRAYRDFMAAIPSDLRHLPVYITETDQNEAWDTVNRGWVRSAYKEIDTWNAMPDNQQIRALVLYRWPRYDRWYIEGNTAVIEDLAAAMQNEYTWREYRPPVVINGHVVRGPFFDLYNRVGRSTCGMPITDELIEDGLKTQYFENLVMQQDATGAVVLKPTGTEVLSLRETTRRANQQIRALSCQVELLENRIAELESQDGSTPGPPEQQIVEVTRPLWRNVTYHLLRHTTDRYPARNLSQVKYIVIGHSAVSGSVTAQRIADFHVNHLGWPGIGYHYYIDGQGDIFKTNPLRVACSHLGASDPLVVSICVGGNFTEEIPTPRQLSQTGHLVAWLLQELDLTPQAVVGKSRFADTQSPGRQWLQGQRWRDLLLAQVERAREEETAAYLPKRLGHYVLFGTDTAGWSDREWAWAQEYISRFQATGGFSSTDARLARFVTLIGGTTDIGSRVEAALIEAGCRVERIEGQTARDTARILQNMAAMDSRFQDYPG